MEVILALGKPKRGLSWVLGQLGIDSETLLQNENKNKNKTKKQKPKPKTKQKSQSGR